MASLRARSVSQSDLSASRALLTAPVATTLLRLSLPNALSLLAGTAVAIAETAVAGRIGVDALAAMAIVFPLFLLLQMMAAGAMGGGISSAVARAIGGDDTERASALVAHAIVIAIAAGLLFAAFATVFGTWLFRLLGARDGVLDAARQYANVAFTGAVLVWLMYALAAVVRGSGNMALAAQALLLSALVQAITSALLGLGLLGAPRLGMAGLGIGLLLGSTAAIVLQAVYLVSPARQVRLVLRLGNFDRALFYDILKVGALACYSACQAIATLLILAHLAGRMSPIALAGYGIGVRLEQLMIPVAYAVGLSATAMIGMAIGAGDVARARGVAWSAGAIAAAATGTVGMVAALLPDLWSAPFTADAAVRSGAATYLAVAGPAFAAFGFAHCLYFASQGSGRIAPLVVAQAVRLLVVAFGALWLLRTEVTLLGVALVAAAGLTTYGAAAFLAVWAANWLPSAQTTSCKVRT